ncbi:MAG: DUF4244 domain-containing protein [Acidimicrobiales bacterium]
MLHLYVALDSFIRNRRHQPPERGQATVEYVLLMLGAAAVALLVLAWATGSGKVSELLDKILDSISGQV